MENWERTANRTCLHLFVPAKILYEPNPAGWNRLESSLGSEDGVSRRGNLKGEGGGKGEVPEVVHLTLPPARQLQNQYSSHQLYGGIVECTAWLSK